MIHTKCPNPELISRVLINLEKEITCSEYICKSSLVPRPSIAGGWGGGGGVGVGGVPAVHTVCAWVYFKCDYYVNFNCDILRMGWA